MPLVVILICLAVQYYLKFSSHAYQIKWAEKYFLWVNSKFQQVTAGHGLVGLIILVLPLVLAVSIIFAIAYHMLGNIGLYILSLVLLWYCMDARDLKKDPYPKATVNDVFMLRYRYVFAILFWYFVFGPVGLALYVVVAELNWFLASYKEEKAASIRNYFQLAQGVFDWVPLRILGLSFALVGHFAATFKLLMHDLLKGLRSDCAQAATWGMAALTGQADSSSESKTDSSETASADADQMKHAIAILDRALIVWLVVMALLVFGYWWG